MSATFRPATNVYVFRPALLRLWVTYYNRPIGGFYYPVPPPYGYCCYSSSQIAGAVAITVAGASMMYAAGSYYEKSKSQSGQEQYKVVSAPAGATLPKTAVPADAEMVTPSGTTFYYYSNTFYRVASVNGQMGFVVVEQPAGVQTVKALPADVQPKQVGDTTYLVSGGRYYLVNTDAAGKESYIVVDAPKAAWREPGRLGTPAPRRVQLRTQLVMSWVRLSSRIGM